jgi:hypothetical protein
MAQKLPLHIPSAKLKSYIHCAIIVEFSGVPHVLLSKHMTWPVYLIPNFNKMGCNIKRALRNLEDLPDIQPLEGIEEAKGITNSTEGCTRNVICTELNNREMYITPSGGGFSHCNYIIKICPCAEEQAESVKKGIELDPAILKTRWFSKEELDNKEHISLDPSAKELFGDPKQGFFPDNLDIINVVFEHYAQHKSK